MIVVLLIIIACVLLFGADKTKSGMGYLFWAFIIMGVLGSCMNMLD